MTEPLGPTGRRLGNRPEYAATRMGDGERQVRIGCPSLTSPLSPLQWFSHVQPRRRSDIGWPASGHVRAGDGAAGLHDPVRQSVHPGHLPPGRPSSATARGHRPDAAETPPDAPELPPEALPDDTLSTRCPAVRPAGPARRPGVVGVGGLAPGYRRVQAICDYVTSPDLRLRHTTAISTAADVFERARRLP